MRGAISETRLSSAGECTIWPGEALGSWMLNMSTVFVPTLLDMAGGTTVLLCYGLDTTYKEAGLDSPASAGVCNLAVDIVKLAVGAPGASLVEITADLATATVLACYRRSQSGAPGGCWAERKCRRGHDSERGLSHYGVVIHAAPWTKHYR